MKAIKLYSDNFSGLLVTEAAYQELRLQMSSGDFGTHRIEHVEVSDETDVIDLTDVLLDEPSMCKECGRIK